MREMINDKDMNEEKYTITPACALWCVVREWGLTDTWNTKVYEAAFNDLMETLVRIGYIEEQKEN